MILFLFYYKIRYVLCGARTYPFNSMTLCVVGKHGASHSRQEKSTGQPSTWLLPAGGGGYYHQMRAGHGPKNEKE